MQFYRDGYRPGDPDIWPPAPEAVARPTEIPAELDVLVVGTGPAGAVLTAQLAAFPEINTRVIERREGPLRVGQADGVACRTVEMFQAFGLAEALTREAYWINEVLMWSASPDDRNSLVRTGWVQDTPDGLSEFPHVIVNQARMQQYLFEYAAKSSSKLGVDYGIELVDLTVGDGEHPVTARLRRVAGPDAGEELTVRAKYVVGCDGARSTVRRSIGRELTGDAANHAWGVMDVLATTDFPGWRYKNVIQSAGKGSILSIPREGGNMVRWYVDLGVVPEGDGGAIRRTSVERIVEITNEILHPYSIDVKSVVWSSVYEVGQRLCDAFDDTAGRSDALPSVFITGDACHTHSAKAGQGMNVSMQDAFNLGWKLAAVLTGRCEAGLLRTYSAERQAVAKELIEFDKHWSAFIAQPTFDPLRPELGGVTPQQMEEEFSRQGRFTAGLATHYEPSVLTGSGEHQGLATGFPIGERFHAVKAVRAADARRMYLGHTHRADGRWRIYAFADADGAGLRDLAQWLGESPDSPIARFTPEWADIDAVIDVNGIFQQPHLELLGEMPEVLRPHTGPLGIQDWEKVWSIDVQYGQDPFAERGVSRDGAIVIVRPDQYVAEVLPLGARAELTEFFAGFLVEQRVPIRG
ncbi:FAD-dependent monooxygenase [Nocardioides cheoyonin]|uniref:FAD-dependent monooxygenase n=1 Tax=Nocardioides cheoyonin TaxID=3156615 RepID=UPI0032B531C9